MEVKLYRVEYEFLFKDGKKKNFVIDINPRTMNNVMPELKSIPGWTRLDYHQCPCCPLTVDVIPYCPVALNIAELVQEFRSMQSTDVCTVRCTTPERTYVKETALQEGLFSIFGLINATSICPVMGKYKPMARFHLPFSNYKESIVRTVSFYLLGQYFEYKKGSRPDLELDQLNEHFKKVHEVDEAILARIDNIPGKDADRNAYVILNSLVQILSMEIDDQLHAIEDLFQFDS